MGPRHDNQAVRRPADADHKSAREQMQSGERGDGFVYVRGAREHNLQDVDVRIPRDALTVFTGISGSGKSSLALGTLYAEAQRRYFESVAPYARRLIQQVGVPEVRDITGLPPAIALTQRRGVPTTRSTVGTVTTLSNLLRMLFSRAGTYPSGTTTRMDSDAFSPNTAAGACAECHGLGRIYSVTEDSLVPNPSLSVGERAIAAWPGAWHGKNLRDVLDALGYDIHRPWRELPQDERDWMLFTDEQPVITVYPVRQAGTVQGPYQGKYMSARRYVLHTLAESKSRALRQRALRHAQISACQACSGTRLRPEALAVTFGDCTIADLGSMPLSRLADMLRPTAGLSRCRPTWASSESSEHSDVAVTITEDVVDRIDSLIQLGLGYLSLARPTPTLSPGELQRLRIATQLRVGLFGVVYVLDEPSAGLHPADLEAVLVILDRLRCAGNTLFVVEHDMDIVRRADWVVDMGPGAGKQGGRVLYSGPVAGLHGVVDSVTRQFLFVDCRGGENSRAVRRPSGWLRLRGVRQNNLHGLDADIPIGVFTAVAGVSGSGKSSLVSQGLVRIVSRHLDGVEQVADKELSEVDVEDLEETGGVGAGGLECFERLVWIDQKPIGRTPRSNLATYTGLFDGVRKVFAATEEARARRYTASRFSFNVAGGRCATCQGEGFVAVELLFLPGSYAPCPTCHGARYRPDTLEVRYRGRSIAEVLDLTVDNAAQFFAGASTIERSLLMLKEVGLGYLRLGQPATELSGGEAQRIKLATELQRGRRQHALYLLDEPTVGLHPADVQRLALQLHQLVDVGNTVVVVEHDLDVIAGADWVIDMGPGGGDEGGRIVAAGTPAEVATAPGSRTAPYLRRHLREGIPPSVTGTSD